MTDPDGLRRHRHLLPRQLGALLSLGGSRQLPAASGGSAQRVPPSPRCSWGANPNRLQGVYCGWWPSPGPSSGWKQPFLSIMCVWGAPVRAPPPGIHWGGFNPC